MNFLFGFSGRIGRGMWWLAQLIPLIVWVMVFAAFAGIARVSDLSADHQPGELSPGGLGLGIAILIGCVVVAWINFATCIKRFHDREKSGWWMLISFIPLIGPIWLVVECGFLAGTAGNNIYGPPPGSSGGNYDDSTVSDWVQAAQSSVMTLAAAPAPAAVTAEARAPRSQTISGKPVFGRRGA